MWDREAVLPIENVPGRRQCPGAHGTAPEVQFRPGRFRDLSPDGRHLIAGWASRADRTLAAGTGEAPNRGGAQRSSRNEFEAFIYAWISFNGWASCCCDEDRDRVLINVLRSDERVTAHFDALVDFNPAVANALGKFRSLWPIFRANDVRSGIDTAVTTESASGRVGLVTYYTNNFPQARRSPDCHIRHGGESIVPDWAHTLEALYQVRCNLFHGTKSADAAADREIVAAASAVLVPVVKHLVSPEFT